MKNTKHVTTSFKLSWPVIRRSPIQSPPGVLVHPTFPNRYFVITLAAAQLWASRRVRFSRKYHLPSSDPNWSLNVVHLAGVSGSWSEYAFAQHGLCRQLAPEEGHSFTERASFKTQTYTTWYPKVSSSQALAHSCFSRTLFILAHSLAPGSFQSFTLCSIPVLAKSHHHKVVSKSVITCLKKQVTVNKTVDRPNVNLSFSDLLPFSTTQIKPSKNSFDFTCLSVCLLFEQELDQKAPRPLCRQNLLVYYCNFWVSLKPIRADETKNCSCKVCLRWSLKSHLWDSQPIKLCLPGTNLTSELSPHLSLHVGRQSSRNHLAWCLFSTYHDFSKYKPVNAFMYLFPRSHHEKREQGSPQWSKKDMQMD